MNSVSRPTRAGRCARRAARSAGSEIQRCTKGGGPVLRDRPPAYRLPDPAAIVHHAASPVLQDVRDSMSLQTTTLAVCVLFALAACEGKRGEDARQAQAGRDPLVTISGEGAVVVPAWQPPPVHIAPGDEAKVFAEAEAALA